MKRLLLILVALALVTLALIVLARDGRHEDSALSPDGGLFPTAPAASVDVEPAAPERQVPAEPVQTRREQSAPLIAVSATQSLSGRLLGPSGPIAKAEISLSMADGRELLRGQSDESGMFFLPLPEPIEGASLQIGASGYAPLLRAGERVQRGERRFLGTLRLEPGVPLAGLVVDERGEPLAAARVDLRATAGSNLAHRPLASVRSGSDGRFRIEQAPQGALRLEAWAEGHGARALEPVNTPFEGELRVQLVPEQRLVLHVRSKRGELLAGARVELAALDRLAPTAEGVTDDRGSLELTGLGASEWGLRVSAGGYRVLTLPRVRTNSEPFEVELVPWPCLSGAVLLDSGSPAPAGTHVSLRPTDGRGALLDAPAKASTQSAADGSFRLCDLRPGVYVAEARLEGYAPARSELIQLKLEAQESRVELRLGAGAELQLTVRCDGERLRGALVDAVASPPSVLEVAQGEWATGSPLRTPIASATSDSEGLASLAHLPDGPVYAVIRAEGCLPSVQGPYHPEPGARLLKVDVELKKGGRVRGRVLGAGERGLPGALVIFRNSARTQGPLRATADVEGRYLSPLMEPGSYKVTARSVSGLATAERSAEAIVSVERGVEAELELRIQ